MQSHRTSTSRRRLTIADLRSVTGLIIGLYVTMHLSNHALGLISVRAQEAVRPWVMALWHSPPGQVLLYGSLSTHAAIALIILFRRRHYLAPIGMSVLEVSRMARRAHMSVCGGRGRYTTCRVQIAGAAGELPEPGELESNALAGYLRRSDRLSRSFLRLGSLLD
jgi:ferredoxin